jgi:hypothetical protein
MNVCMPVYCVCMCAFAVYVCLCIYACMIALQCHANSVKLRIVHVCIYACILCIYACMIACMHTMSELLPAPRGQILTHESTVRLARACCRLEHASSSSRADHRWPCSTHACPSFEYIRHHDIMMASIHSQQHACLPKFRVHSSP